MVSMLKRKQQFPEGGLEELLAPGPETVDEDRQRSKDSADAAAAVDVVVKKREKSRINTVTKPFLSSLYIFIISV